MKSPNDWEKNAGIVSILTAERVMEMVQKINLEEKKAAPTDWNYLSYDIELIFTSRYELAGIWFIRIDFSSFFYLLLLFAYIFPNIGAIFTKCCKSKNRCSANCKSSNVFYFLRNEKFWKFEISEASYLYYLLADMKRYFDSKKKSKQ